MAIATLYLVGILLAIPAAMLFIIFRARAENRLLDLQFSHRFGIFYEQFKASPCALGGQL